MLLWTPGLPSFGLSFGLGFLCLLMLLRCIFDQLEIALPCGSFHWPLNPTLMLLKPWKFLLRAAHMYSWHVVM